MSLALDAIGVQVLWPRYLDRDVTSRVVLSGPPASREEPLQTGLFGPDALFGFSWQLALHGDALSDQEMDDLATAATPIIKIRDNWTIVDSAVLKRARKRLIKRVAPAAALAATLTEVVQVEDVEHQAVVGASLLKVRDQLRTAAVREPIEVPAGLAATLRDYQRHGFSWLAELTSLGLGACLADDMGLGKTVQVIALHLHRHEGAGRTRAGRRWWCARRRCWATGRPRSGGSPPAYPSGASTVPVARWTGWSRTRTTCSPRWTGPQRATRGSC